MLTEVWTRLHTSCIQARPSAVRLKAPCVMGHNAHWMDLDPPGSCPAPWTSQRRGRILCWGTPAMRCSSSYTLQGQHSHSPEEQLSGLAPILHETDLGFCVLHGRSCEYCNFAQGIDKNLGFSISPKGKAVGHCMCSESKAECITDFPFDQPQVQHVCSE